MCKKRQAKRLRKCACSPDGMRMATSQCQIDFSSWLKDQSRAQLCTITKHNDAPSCQMPPSSLVPKLKDKCLKLKRHQYVSGFVLGLTGQGPILKVCMEEMEKRA
jgi:hypothetical protein